jgi:hypothetical protein
MCGDIGGARSAPGCIWRDSCELQYDLVDENAREKLQARERFTVVDSVLTP